MSEAAQDPRVRAVFDAYPPSLREALEDLADFSVSRAI